MRTERISGIFTDGDLRRAMERLGDLRATPVSAVMTRGPRSIGPRRLAVEAVEMMETLRINQLLVTDDAGTLLRRAEHARPVPRQGGLMSQALAKAAKLVLMGFDVDGVLTDGTLYFGSQGDEIKAFSSLDGHGLKMLQHAGIEVAIISGRSSPALRCAPKTSASANCTWASRTSAA
jgi:hypothetical protein